MASVTDPATGGSLYAAAPKIYARSVQGRLARLRWGMVFLTQAVFYGTPWVNWDGHQAVLFDIASRRFHLFALTLWPQDFILLTGLLVACALSLFLFTAVAGRLWCGFSCPQTVYTSLFMWLEEATEGGWKARQKRDAGAWNRSTWLRKGTKHALWGALAAWTGISFVGYFTPVRTLVPSLFTWQAGGWETFWVLFYGFATYGNAGWMREQVCKYMCPYARFQGVMMDADTVTVSYDPVRGEPRGGRARHTVATGLGDCIDCHLCVQVCPTGIDIRNGLQIECLNCGLCVDACNSIMARQGAAPGLIRYTSERLLARAAPSCAGCASQGAPTCGTAACPAPHPLLRRRVLLYAGLLTLVLGALLGTLATRVPVRLDVMRDRAVMARETPEGAVENIYRLQVLNMSARPRRFEVQVRGPSGMHLAGRAHTVDVAALSTAQLAVDVDVDPAALRQMRTPIQLQVQATDDAAVIAQSRTQFFAGLGRTFNLNGSPAP